ncbi:MAG: hypothetical protein Q4B48_05485 [Syntrophomonadaceae bacterium]|nr:hypothetical protein [Syntrophomonadaceae bacterium]
MALGKDDKKPGKIIDKAARKAAAEEHNNEKVAQMYARHRPCSEVRDKWQEKIDKATVDFEAKLARKKELYRETGD